MKTRQTRLVAGFVLLAIIQFFSTMRLMDGYPFQALLQQAWDQISELIYALATGSLTENWRALWDQGLPVLFPVLFQAFGLLAMAFLFVCCFAGTAPKAGGALKLIFLVWPGTAVFQFIWWFLMGLLRLPGEVKIPFVTLDFSFAFGRSLRYVLPILAMLLFILLAFDFKLRWRGVIPLVILLGGLLLSTVLYALTYHFIGGQFYEWVSRSADILYFTLQAGLLMWYFSHGLHDRRKG